MQSTEAILIAMPTPMPTKVTFRIEKIGKNGKEIHYFMAIHHKNGASETRGAALKGEDIEITEEELRVDSPEEDEEEIEEADEDDDS
jgi:hypothetical protein